LRPSPSPLVGEGRGGGARRGTTRSLGDTQGPDDRDRRSGASCHPEPRRRKFCVGPTAANPSHRLVSSSDCNVLADFAIVIDRKAIFACVDFDGGRVDFSPRSPLDVTTRLGPLTGGRDRA
jgi:hypothetical protein